ncbi:MG2 domain-containing protein [Archangium lipolyticum]|uniref:MG2 domain-containing protein n=1 Tax=Archangium lipolyticum TaxID=2970465 RepID=UPI00214A3AEF|nr:MG2 domain-containing protein [Archangium lipolyticum]
MNIRLKRRVALGFAAGLFAGVVGWATSDVCVSTWLFQGVKVPRCPDGRLRQVPSLFVEGLARETTGSVAVSAEAHGVTSRDGERLAAPVRRLDASLFLVDAQGKESPLEPELDWKQDSSFTLRSRVKLPALPDGDYRLRARVTSPLGTDTVEAPLALYAPARVHVLSDRPLYEPGHQVRFRAVVLRAKDLAPIDGRPGTWFVIDPSGEVVLEQRAPAGPWGVVAGDFPLDSGAPTGRWTVRWTSGDASAETSFQVKPFTLPRFRVEAQSTRPFWRAGESPVVEGQVVYSSGAPVADAAVDVNWNASGGWPPPNEWLDEKAKDGLPRKARTDASGHFRLTLPRVPYDLRGQATLSAWLSATDPAGDQVQSGASVLLAEDALSVSAVTELEDGLVEGYSNRVYLRATSADGRLLPGAELTVKRAWDPRDEGVRAVTDEDGVAAFQLDPGPPVNVVIPAMPVRRVPPPPPVALGSVRDLLSEDGEPGLEDQLALERWLGSLRPCARFVAEDGSASVTLGVRVASGGTVVDVTAEESPLGDCLASAVRARTLPPGRERMLSLALEVSDPGLPVLSFEADDVSGGDSSEGVQAALGSALLDARACLPENLSLSAPLPATLTWRTRAGRREVEVGWLSLPQARGMLSAEHLPCIQSRFTRLMLMYEAGAPENAMGVVRLTAEPQGHGESDGVSQETTLLGYELRVSATAGKEDLGATKLVLHPARLPPTRLRATPVLARAGEEVRIELLRGPDFNGELPKTLYLQAGEERLEAEVEKPGPVARFRLPVGFEGWAEASWAGAVARVYVAPRAQLSLEVAPDKAAYAPGELAHLQVHTRVDGQAGPAAVGLFGVDESLSQLASLPGTGALDGMRPAPTLASPAFGVLDGTALAMGRIRGANAAAATLLRVSGLPQRNGGEKPVSVAVRGNFMPDVELTEPFYRVLAELTVQVRAWEASAPPGETLSAAGMTKLWERALEACEKRGEAVTDAYGRTLKLSRLPPELLALTDPRAVVVSGTRLPEDVENWGAWVARESP